MSDQQDQNPQKLDYNKDIRTPSTRDIIADQHAAWDNDEWNDKGEKKQVQATAEPAETQPSATPPKEDDKPVETKPAEQTPQETKPTPPAESKPAFDEEKLVEKITSKLLETLAPKEEAKQKTLDDRVTELQDKAKAEGRELTYKDALSAVKDELTETLPKTLTEQITKQVMENLNKQVDDEAKKQQETQQAQKTQDETNKKAMFSEWDRQVGVMQREMGLPKIINKDDPEDPGVKAQELIFKAMNMRVEKQKAAKEKVSLSLIEAYHSPEYKQLTEQPGRDAPINGAKRSIGPTNGKELSYADIHNADLRDLVAEVYNNPQN